MARPTPPRLIIVATSALLLASSVTAAPASKKEARPAQAPVLVSTEGESTAWSTVQELAAAAEKKDPVAAFEYARLLESGDQVKADPARALALYRTAAEAGHRDALFRLGKVHHDGLLQQPVNYARAADYYLQAAAAGVPEAMYNLGAMHVSARGVKRDYVGGLAWLLVAQRQGADATAGIEQVRQRLSRRPEQIAAGERRAETLAALLKTGEVPALNGTPRPQPLAPLVRPEAPGAQAKAPVNLTPDSETTRTLRPPPVPLTTPALTLPPPPAPAPRGGPSELKTEAALPEKN